MAVIQESSNVKQINTRVPIGLLNKAREHSGLYVSTTALARIGIAVLAGYSLEEATKRFYSPTLGVESLMDESANAQADAADRASADRVSA